MTKKEALLGVVNYPLPGFDFAVEKTLIDAGLNGEDMYSAADIRAIDLCAAELILFVTRSPKTISDLGFSISANDREGLLATRSFILQKYGLEDQPPGSRIFTEDLW